MIHRWMPFEYRDFYDVPHMLVIRDGDTWYLFDSKFDELRDDYDDSYEVYEMPMLTQEQLRGDWRGFPELARRHLGKVRIDDVHFDPSKRKEIDLGVMAQVGC